MTKSRPANAACASSNQEPMALGWSTSTSLVGSSTLSRSQSAGESTIDALADETAAEILRESARLPEREKRVVLGIVREFGEGC